MDRRTAAAAYLADAGIERSRLTAASAALIAAIFGVALTLFKATDKYFADVI